MNDAKADAKEIFLGALDCTSADDLARFLDEACAGDAGLRARVEDLLRARRQAGSFLGGAWTSATEEFAIAESAGTVIGPYKLLQEIGEGGMGVVFMAEQTAPVRRKVALKIVKPGMDTKQVIARFEAERQALAIMDHPNIARVFDAGATESGRPFFVMELVHGVPITDYCNLQKLTPDERLRLFIDVCRAVQHAHQKGIIHRDLKPSNIMVTMHDDKSIPKIIDFGVSKAISHQLTEKTLFTAYGQMVGTPMYVSPEQAQLSGLDVDTRSDIYSLGVLLYELVTGTAPFDEATLKRVDFDEMRRLIREEEPLRPSLRINTLKADLLSTVADQRKLDPQKLSQTLRGEVDWIVMKCLEKDRNRRYESANALAQDIERYLNDEPVQACPPSATYRIGKFVRRHKAALATAGLLAGVLVLGVIGLAIGTLLIWRANSETRQALDRERRSAYFQQVALAEREWAVNNFKRADELLAHCPIELRGWEWNYVKRLRGRQIQPLRHDAAVSDCAMSPDGRQIVSLDSSGRIYCWDAITGRAIRPPFRGHDSAAGVTCDVVFTPDGSRFATLGWDEVKVWDAMSGEQLNVWRAARDRNESHSGIQALACGSDDNLMVCVCTRAGENEDTRIWDPVTGKELFSLPHVDHQVLDMAISPDDRLLALACVDSTVWLVDAHTGEAKQSLHGDRSFWCVSFSRNGKLVAAGTGGEGEQNSGTVRIWNVESGRERAPLTGHGAQCIAFSPDGERLATGGADQAAKIWDIASGQEILTLRGHTDWVQGIAFTPDGRRLVSAGDRSVRFWDGRPWSGRVEVGEEAVTLRGHADSVNAVAFRPRSGEVATASTDGTIKFWDTSTWRELRTVRAGFDQVSALAFSPLGDRMAVSGFPNRPVVILDAVTGDELERLGDTSGGEVIAFSANGRLLAVGNEEGLVTINDLENGQVRKRLQAPGKYLYSVRFSPDDRFIAAAGMDSAITIWETASGREIDASPLKHRGLIYSVAFSPDGKFLASGGWDRTVRIWDTTTWKQVQVVIDATAAMQSVDFSPDGQYLAWGATDSSVKLWHRATGELHTLRGHLGYIRSVAFSPDGSLIASASEDGTAKIWNVPRDEIKP